MKAAVYRRNGGPEVLSYEDVPDPVPATDEVLIRTEAISIEGGDLMCRLLIPPPADGFVIGYSSAGEVVAVGSAVTGLEVGQKVCAFGQAHGLPAGSHAELRVVRPEHCWALPDGFDPKAAALVPVTFSTAYEALFERGRLTSGDTVLVQGAASGVGLAAMQLAKKAGARVIGSASNPARFEELRRYGLDEGIDYRGENVRDRVLALTGGRGVDLAVDCVGGPLLQQLIEATRHGGHIVPLGTASREESTVDVVSLIRSNTTLHGVGLASLLHEPRVHAYMADLIRRIADGELEAVIDRVFPLADAAAAHHYAEQRGRIGRVVMVP
ncbi:zinc-binding alcohol dehydrogenase family protein [Streptomyces sp. NPDC001351]|uniref:quinone oxidoreductase family protein n=1 Tax=Streptomyces sp. NPDC001351 TaxID=3364564 RepID=UPI0036BE91FE